MEWCETVTMSFFLRTIAGLRPDQQSSYRSRRTVPAKPVSSHNEAGEVARLRQGRRQGDHDDDRDSRRLPGFVAGEESLRPSGDGDARWLAAGYAGVVRLHRRQ